MKYIKPENIKRWMDVYTRHKQVELALAKLSFSQYGEDLYVFNKLSRRGVGFYVDVGAFHPISISNTHLLYKSGWSGINIEPNPGAISAFGFYRPRDINLSCAVGTRAGHVNLTLEGVFSKTTDMVSDDVNSASVQVRRLDEILGVYAHDRIIDVMSVDCEGNDIDVLKSNDWSKFRPKILLVEAISKEDNENMDVFLAGIGYVKDVRIVITNIYIDTLN
jgi:FkbM family methyltransferase